MENSFGKKDAKIILVDEGPDHRRYIRHKLGIRLVLPMVFILTGCAADFAALVTVWPLDGRVPYFHLTWFLGSIVGGVISSLLLSVLNKKFFCFISALILISSCLYKVIEADYAILSLCNTLSGIGYGLLFLPSVAFAQEVCDKRNLGKVLSMISTTLTMGYLVFAFSLSFHNVDSKHGYRTVLVICQMSLASLGMLFSLFLIESPVFLLRKQDEEQAVICLQAIRKEVQLTPGARHEIEKIKETIEENDGETWSMISSGGFEDIAQIALPQIAKGLMYSVPLYAVLFDVATVSTHKIIGALFLILTRLGVEVFALRKLDFVKRRDLAKMAYIPAAMSLSIYGLLVNYEGTDPTTVAGIICMMPFQLSSGIAANQLAMVTSVTTYPKFINQVPVLIALGVEMITHMVAIALAHIHGYFVGQFFVIGITVAGIGLYLLKLLPNPIPILITKQEPTSTN